MRGCGQGLIQAGVWGQVGAGRDTGRGRQGCGQGAGRGQAGKPSAQHSWLALDLDNCSPFPPGGARSEASTSKRKLSA